MKGSDIIAAHAGDVKTLVGPRARTEATGLVRMLNLDAPLPDGWTWGARDSGDGTWQVKPTRRWHTLVKGHEHGGTQFHTGPKVDDPTRPLDRRIVVKRIQWQAPGFANKTSRGWVVLVDGWQTAGAFRTVREAKDHIEQPGVAKMIEERLNAA